MFGLANKEQLNQQYQEQLLECIDSMYNLAYRFCFNKEEAEDIVQDASIRGFRFYHQFQQGTNFKAWILTIVRNTFINGYRKKAKEPSKINYDEFEGMISLPDTNILNEEIFGEAVQTSINDLSEEMREVVVLFYVDGLSYKEIAGVVKCPIGTVMSRMHMAKQILKKKLLKFKQLEG